MAVLMEEGIRLLATVDGMGDVTGELLGEGIGVGMGGGMEKDMVELTTVPAVYPPRHPQPRLDEGASVEEAPEERLSLHAMGNSTGTLSIVECRVDVPTDA